MLVHEAGEWAAFIRGTPMARTGASCSAAVNDLADAVREYAEDWTDRLHLAANHQSLRSLAQLAWRSTDDELRRWLMELITAPGMPIARP